MTSTPEKHGAAEHSAEKHSASGPASAYAQRHACRAEAARRDHRFLRRLVLAKRTYLGAMIGYAVFDPTVAAVLLPVAISLVPVLIIQYWLVQRWRRNHRAAVYYQRALARLRGHWIGSGDPGDRYLDSGHLYAADLDLFGRGSLFQMLCTPCTASGRDMLAHWLRRPADLLTVRARQAAVQEIASDLDWREALDAAGDALPRVPLADIRTVAAAQRAVTRSWMRPWVALAGWCAVASCWMAWVYGGWWWSVCLCGLAWETVAYCLLRARMHVLCGRGYQVGLSLMAVATFSRLVMTVPWRSELLRDHRDALHRPPGPLHPLAVAPLGLCLQLPVVHFLAVQLVPVWEQRLLARVGRVPAAWESIGQWESLAAFAALAFEHPDDCFPAFTPDGACFVASEMGHPLIPADCAIRNDIRLDDQLRLLMVSGSNMSGKSTLLRTVGVNAVLALAGAPVRARALRLSPLAIGTAMRFRDSLEQGSSYFHAVLCRLGAVLELLNQPCPLLFLFDEILPGTNSHDRLVGAEAVIRRLLVGKAIGLVTTHDLELTRVVDHLAPLTANIHFAEQVVAGELRFDYRIRPGVVQSSNALALMRNMGLDV